jgi:predicted enzyme related to lactoylglutathione lyase
MWSSQRPTEGVVANRPVHFEMGTLGIDGGLTRRQGRIDGTAVIAYVCSIDGDNIDRSMKDAAARGQIVVSKNAVPGIGWSAYAKDPEGNIFGIYQRDRNAG